VLDLSEAAARRLDTLAAGVVMMDLEVIAKPGHATTLQATVAGPGLIRLKRRRHP
jgi:rare lipoprotein A (peptidoglycan hydrolase)